VYLLLLRQQLPAEQRITTQVPMWSESCKTADPSLDGSAAVVTEQYRRSASQDSAHSTSVSPSCSALGLLTFGTLSERYFGICPNPASTEAQCHADALSMLSALM
jgi:hypothetical protein